MGTHLEMLEFFRRHRTGRSDKDPLTWATASENTAFNIHYLLLSLAYFFLFSIGLSKAFSTRIFLDVQEVLNRLPPEVVDARNQRIKHAMDLSMKHDYLPKELSKNNEEISLTL